MGRCIPGCTCKRHIAYAISAEAIQRRSAKLRGHTVSTETREKISKALTGRRLTDEQRTERRGRVYPPWTADRQEAMSILARERKFWRNFRGGATGDDFAVVLEPAGFVREYLVQHGSSRGQGYHLDFAHVEAKVNIELDGPYHDQRNDDVRDAYLRSLGWKVIRIRHE